MQKDKSRIKNCKSLYILNFRFLIFDSRKGFTLLELIIVMFLISIMLAFSAVFFGNALPSGRFNATTRELAAAVRHARTLSQLNGEKQSVLIDLDSGKYGIKGRGEKKLPPDVNIKIVDPFYGEISKGKFQFVFHTAGSAEGGTIVLWNRKKTVNINIDPIVGAVVIR